MRKDWSTLALLVSFLFVFTACSQSSTTTSSAQSQQEENKLEIFSWSATSAEAAGFQALLTLFAQKQPGTEVMVPRDVTAKAELQAELTSRMKKNNPPDLFRVHGGRELQEGWVAADQLQPLNELFMQQEWIDKFPASLVQMVSHEGNIYALPTHVHRSNVLWYNKKLFDQHGLNPPATFDDFFKVADALQAKGITPLALGDKETWADTHLFESVLVGTLGPIDYNKLWTGHVRFDDPRIKQALTTYKKMLSYANRDHASLTWQDAVRRVGRGEAAMTVMGDWAKGYITNDLKLKLSQDIGFAPSPNTKGIFIAIPEAFSLPKGAKHPVQAKHFLELLGSLEGQDAFNPHSGSVPARLDVALNKYDAYGKSTIKDFQKDFITPSLAHGSAASPTFVNRFNQWIADFVESGDLSSALASLKQIAPTTGLGAKK